MRAVVAFWRCLALVACLVLGSSSCDRDPLADVVAGGSPLLFTSARDGNYDIYMMEPDGSALRRLTSVAAIDQSADWSPDRSRLAFMSNREGGYQVWLTIVTRRWVRQLTNEAAASGFPRWSRPDSACGSPHAWACEREARWVRPHPWRAPAGDAAASACSRSHSRSSAFSIPTE